MISCLIRRTNDTSRHADDVRRTKSARNMDDYLNTQPIVDHVDDSNVHWLSLLAMPVSIVCRGHEEVCEVHSLDCLMPSYSLLR